MMATEDAVTVPLAELVPYLSLLNRFTATQDLVPGLQQFWFSGSSVWSCAGSAGAGLETPWTFPECTLPADHLMSLAESLHVQGHAEVTLAAREASVGVTSGKFRASLRRYHPDPGEDLSVYARRAVPTGDRVPLTPAWWAALDRVTFTVCQDETKAPLRGVYWTRSGALLSTDTYRITALMPPEECRVAPPVSGGLLIPDHLLTRLAGRRREVTAVCLEGTAVLWLFLPSGAVYGALIAGAFPEAGAVAVFTQARQQATAGGTWVGLSEGPPLEVVLDRLLRFAEPPTYHLSGTVTDGGDVRLAVSGPRGEAEETLPARVTGPPTQFAVNGRYLREALLSVGPQFWVLPASSMVYFVSADRCLEHVVMLLRA